jgi:DNA mismatch endonuclease (patch repair protein)
MRANRRRDTSPEIAIRRALHAQGFRFRVDLAIRPGPGRLVRPDVIFTRAMVAVFIDGCYWHGCPEHGRRVSGANAFYWGPKIARNQERDAEQTARLECAGWRVIRIWEHEDTKEAVQRIADAVQPAAPRRELPHGSGRCFTAARFEGHVHR